MIRTLLPLLILASCANKPSQGKLFPYGVYQHEVNLEVKGKSYQFPGVNRWTKDELTMVALGAFDVTLLKYIENLKNYKKEIYIDKNFIPLSEEKALMYLGLVKNLYSLDRSICEKRTCKKSFFGQKFVFDLNEKKEVSNIRFKRGETKINVKVVGYEKIAK